MVQPAKKKDSSSELENNRGNNKRKGGSDVGQEKVASAPKKQGRPPSDHAASPPTPRKRARGGEASTNDSNSLAESTTTISEVDSTNVPAIRENAIEKRMEMIKQLLEQKEIELKEIAFLEAGNNLLDFDPANKKIVPKEEPTDITGPSADTNKKGSRSNTPARTKRQSSSDSLLTQAQTPPPAPQTPLQATPDATSATAPQTPIQQLPTFPSIFTTPPPISDKDKEKAIHDAAIIKRVGELQRTGMWSLKRMPKAPEPPRVKVHWDHLLAEMTWLANDFKQERKWKMALAKKVSKQVMRWHQMQETRELRKIKEEEQQIRKVASGIAREVKKFWQKIEKVVMFKQQTKLDEKKKEVMDKHLDFLVGQTEKYFEMIASDLKPQEAEPQPQENITEVDQESKPTEESTLARSHTQDLLMETEEAPEGEEATEEDAEFVLPEGAAEEVDDEDTLEEEETKEDTDLPKGEEELSQLQQESEMPLDEIIKKIKEQGGEEGDEEEAEEDEEDEEDDEGKTGKERISEAAAAATAAQPTGFTLSTTKVKTKVPFLLHGTLREYQHIGLDWIVTMYEKRLNGILADEMGLGKTIMTISMLAHLACEKGIWGPHLIVVPTSVMLNWEMEFKKWCPAFKILTYFGSQKERKLKRQGWSKTNSFHVCITSYKVVVQDQQAFRRKKWKYFILDEAHNIKNFRSQRWQVLLNFNSKRRLLLTGTPLQNSLMELWSLMHFLMPHMFQSHKEFKDWFSNPVTGMIEGTETLNEDLITRLHAVLRPFLLRRLKKDVEKQLPNKYHHVVNCQLSKRQRFLYEEFISSAATQDTLKSGNFLGIINVLMQLRKVCNHPDLFEGRPIISPFDMDPIEFYTSSAVCRALEQDPFKSVNLPFLNLSLASTELEVGHLQALSTSQLRTPPRIIELSASPPSSTPTPTPSFPPSISGPSALDEMRAAREERLYQAQLSNLKQAAYINELRCSRKPLYGWELIRSVKIHKPVQDVHLYAQDPSHYLDYPNALADLVRLPKSRAAELNPSTVTQFVCIIPKARASPPVLGCPHPHPSTLFAQQRTAVELPLALSPMVDIFRPGFVRTQVYFPDKRLVQYDCGKLQQLDTLLRTLKSGSHRALIFTQMTRMLDVLEAFLNIHGYTYLRLDGATKVEKRQQLTERFNADPKIFVFILSTRSGGVGINLTGADSVIFYDSDWNPAMDAQAQDRCHRIGQTRDVHIYRLITEYTIEENILKKANQKRHLDDMVIQGGGFTTDFFKNVDIRDLFESSKYQIDNDSAPIQLKDSRNISQRDWESAVANAEDETDATALRQAQAEVDVDVEEFSEEPTQHDGTPVEASQSSATGEDMSFLQDDYEEEQYQQNKLASSSSGFSFEDSLLPIQRYAVHFFESENPEMTQESIAAMDEEVDARKQEWQLEDIKRMKEEEEERMSEDDDLLYYEVSGNAAEFKAKLIAELDVYCPPNPDHEHLYIPPFDGDDYLSYLPPLPPPFFDDYDDEQPLQNEAPEKKTPLPLSPPGEADAEVDSVNVKRKRIRHRKDAANASNAIADTVPHSPPSPPQTKASRRGRPKDPPGGLFNQRRRKQKGETAPVPKVKEGHKDKDPWSTEEDAALNEAIRTYGLNWDLACDVLLSNPSLPSRRFVRTPTACAERYRTVLLPKASGEASTSPPASPLLSPQSQSSQTPRFGIMDVIRSMVTQKKGIPGMIGSAAQTDSAVPPHSSHLQAAMQAGITGNKAYTPRELVASFAHRLNQTVPNKEISPFSKIGLKLDPKISGFGQGYGLGLMALSMASSPTPAMPGPASVPNPSMVAGQSVGVPAGNVPVSNPAAVYSVPVAGATVGMPASNSIIINPNGGNVQTSRKLAQINQSMHPGAVQAGLPRTNVPGTTPTISSAGAPGVVVAIPNATASVTVLPRGNANNGTNANTPVAPTVNVNTTTPVVASAAPAQPTPAASSKPSPSKRSKKNTDGNAGTTKRQRNKNAAAAAAAAAATATAEQTPQPIQPAQPAQPVQQPPQSTQPPQTTPQPAHPQQTQAQNPHIQPQQLHTQIHPLQQIQQQLQQQQLLQHQQPHATQNQTGQIQPQHGHIVTTVAQPQHMQPGIMYQTQQTNPSQPQAQPQPQNQPIQATQPYTNPQYTTAPTYATAGTYTTPTTYSAPATGITYTTAFANAGYAATPGSAPSTYTATPTNYATPNYTNPNPSTYPATYSAGVAPTYATTPSTVPNTYTTASSTAPTTTYVAPTSASNAFTSSGSGFAAPSTYIPNSVSTGAFTTPSTTSYSAAPGYTPQGMVIGMQPQGAMVGGIQNTIKGRPVPQQTTGAPPGTLRPAAMHNQSSSPTGQSPSGSSPSTQ